MFIIDGGVTKVTTLMAGHVIRHLRRITVIRIDLPQLCHRCESVVKDGLKVCRRGRGRF